MDATDHPVEEDSCTFYCRPPYHAVPLLTAPGAWREEVLVSLRPYFAARGWRLVDATRAREADVEQWRSQLVHRVVGTSAQSTLDQLASADAEAWLLLVESAV